MGDKTQLASFAFTTRFKTYQVIFGVVAAIAVTNFIAVVAGGLIGSAVDTGIIRTISCILFILFGVWTLLGKNDETEKTNNKVIINPFFTVLFFFFIAEFGDKTQIATLTLAANGSPLAVFIGAFFGMLLANLLGIALGVFLGKKLPTSAIKWVSAILFIGIGLAGLITIII